MFIILTIVEIFIYFKMYSNILGVIYLFINFFILFMLFTISANYKNANQNIRFSKCMVIIVLGIISSFFISLLVPFIIDYTDSSFVFQNKIFITSKVLKPLLYLSIGIISIFDNDLKIRKYFPVKSK